jgi:hypothetical protein
MRGYVGGEHAGVSAGIPGPTAYLSFLKAVVWVAVVIPYVIIKGIIFCWPVLWWLMRLGVALVVGLVLVVTFPLWAPVYWLWPSKDNPPTPGQPLPPPQFGATRG